MENSWEKYANDFENLNNYVVGLDDMRLLKEEVSKCTNLNKTLELACGNGTYTKILLENASSLTATDISEDMVKVTKDRLGKAKHLTTQLVDSTHLPYEDASFDSVFMANLLHILSDYDAVMREVFRVLKPNGKLYVLDVTTYGMGFFDKIGLIYRYLKSYGKPSKQAKKPKFSLDDMRDLFQTHNFSVEKLELLGSSTKAVFAIGKRL